MVILKARKSQPIKEQKSYKRKNTIHNQFVHWISTAVEKTNSCSKQDRACCSTIAAVLESADMFNRKVKPPCIAKYRYSLKVAPDR